MDSSKKKSEANVLVQGSILSIASMISRVIGLVYRIPLNGILGNHGMDYYGTAFEIYNVLLIISAYSLPLAVSKLVSARLSKGQRVNAYRMFKGALILALISGGTASLILYFGAPTFTAMLKTPLSVFALKVLAPTILVVAVLGVIRGFFQGLGTMMPSAVSQIVEQIMNAKPEDRRLIFEEATGLMVYKSRKEEIERKIDSSKNNLYISHFDNQLCLLGKYPILFL